MTEGCVIWKFSFFFFKLARAICHGYSDLRTKLNGRHCWAIKQVLPKYFHTFLSVSSEAFSFFFPHQRCHPSVFWGVFLFVFAWFFLFWVYGFYAMGKSCYSFGTKGLSGMQADECEVYEVYSGLLDLTAFWSTSQSWLRCLDVLN